MWAASPDHDEAASLFFEGVPQHPDACLSLQKDAWVIFEGSDCLGPHADELHCTRTGLELLAEWVSWANSKINATHATSYVYRQNMSAFAPCVTGCIERVITNTTTCFHAIAVAKALWGTLVSWAALVQDVGVLSVRMGCRGKRDGAP